MNMEYVESGHLQAIGYDAEKGILVIEFKDGTSYEYYDVPEGEYYQLMSAPSKGSYAHKNIYKVYSQQRLS